MSTQADPHQLMIARELQLSAGQVAATAKLLAEGATVPFISRYRKEATGMLDEVQIAAIRDQLARLAELDKRRQAIVASLAERELLTGELQAAVQGAASLAVLEDIYLPYRPKRRTRSLIAREKGLEPLAQSIFTGKCTPSQPQDFVSGEKGVATPDDALAGARDIIAEWISEDAPLRARLRTSLCRQGRHHLRGGEKKSGKRRQVPRLFRLAGPCGQNPGPPAAGHVPRRK